MKEIIRRILVAVWLLLIAAVIFGLAVTFDFFNMLLFSLMFGLPIWTIQLIALGIVNPLKLIRTKEK